MGFIDLLLLCIVGAFVLLGFFFGFIHTLGSLVGTILGIFLTSRLIEPTFASYGFLVGGGNTGRIIVFIVLFVLISRLIGVVFWVLGKIFNILAFIPFAKMFDRLLGAIFGFVEGVMIVGIMIFYAMQVLPQDTLLAALETSALAKLLVALASAMQILLPEALKTTKTIVEQKLPS